MYVTSTLPELRRPNMLSPRLQAPCLELSKPVIPLRVDRYGIKDSARAIQLTTNSRETGQVTSSSASRATTSTSSCGVNSMVIPHPPEPPLGHLLYPRGV